MITQGIPPSCSKTLCLHADSGGRSLKMKFALHPPCISGGKKRFQKQILQFHRLSQVSNWKGLIHPFFFFLVTRETEVFEGNWLGQDDILTSDYRCNLCAFCSTLKLLFCCTYTENLTFSSGSLPRPGTGGTWKYHAAFPYQGQPPWGSVKVYSRWNCPCKAHVFWGKSLFLCSL